MPIIECPNGKVISYAKYEDEIKPLWKEQMRKESQESKEEEN